MCADAPAPNDDSKLWLGIDVGTSRLKAAVYDIGLRVVRESSLETSGLEGSRKGQLNAARLWQALRGQLVNLLSGLDPTRISAMGIAGMAESGCLIDAEARPLTPMLLWHDRRGIRQAAALRRSAGIDFARVTGLKTTNVRSIAKWMWMSDHGASREARWCGAPEWIALCLTGNWRTDETLAVRTGAFNVLEGDYSARLLGLAGAPLDLFPPVHGTPARAGQVLPAVARELDLSDALEIVIAGHDDIVAAYGAGGLPGDLIDSAGTAEGLIRIVDAAPLPAETAKAGMAMTRYYRSGTWALIAGAGSTGALMQKTADLLGLELAELDELANPPGEYGEGLIDIQLSKNALPAIKIKTGAAAREVWSAVLDLVCDRVFQAATRIEGLAGRPARMLLIGGAARSRELVRRKSQRLGLPAVVLAEVDATTRGAAALAALAGDRHSGGSASS